MKKRTGLSFVILFMVLLVLQNVWAGGSKDSASSGPTVNRGNFTPLGTYPIVTNKETITAMVRIELPEQNFDTNWMTSFYEEKTNVHVNWITAPIQQYKERVNLSLASGEQIDVILAGNSAPTSFTMNEMRKFAEQEMILPLQDYLENDSVHFKNNMSKVESWRTVITFPNGGIYWVPTYSGDYHTMYYAKMWVNKLFLENVGLGIPATIDEFHNMLTAFKTKDANGNGDPNDEIPLMGAIDMFGSKLDTFLLSAFVYNDGENRLFLDNGKVTAAYTKAEFQEGLRTLNRWFNEGLIPRDSFTSTRAQRHQLNSNKYESIIGAMPNPHNLNLGSRETGQPVRWIDYEPIVPLKGPRGVQLTRYDHYAPFQMDNPRAFFPATCKNPALVMRWLDWFGTEEGTLMVWFGSSLTDPDPGATGINGRPALYKANVIEPGDPYYNNYRWGEMFPMFRDMDLYQGWQKAEDMLASDGSGQERFLIVKSRENYAPYGQAVRNLIPPMFYTDTDATEMALLTTNINTYVEESIAKFIVGDLDINTGWAAFQNELKNLGIDRYLQTIQNTYDNSAFAKGLLQ